jgi:hypothetical protein
MSSPAAAAAKSPYAGHRFPAEVISHAIWLYFRFPLSPRMVEEMLAARGYCQLNSGRSRLGNSGSRICRFVCHFIRGLGLQRTIIAYFRFAAR